MSAIITANDWRGINVQSTTPITNLCSYSQNFEELPWTNTGAVLQPSKWSTLNSTTSQVYRPSSYNTSNNISGSPPTGTYYVTNPQYAYDAGTNINVKNQYGTYASVSATASSEAPTLSYSNFGTGINVPLTLYIPITTQTVSSEGSGVLVYYNLTSGIGDLTPLASTLPLATSNTLLGVSGNQWQSTGAQFNANTPLTLSLVVPDLNLY